MSKDAWGIHWFRRDLRIGGNPALREIWKKTDGRVVGIFCLDSTFLNRPDFSHNRFGFFLKTIRKMKKEFHDRGGDLLVVEQLPADFFLQLLNSLRADGKPGPQFVSWNRDYEPFARRRDENVEKQLRAAGVEVITARDHLLFEPHEIGKEDKASSYYQIYSPFSRKWFDLLNSEAGAGRIPREAPVAQPKETGEKIFKAEWRTVAPRRFNLTDRLEEFEIRNSREVRIALPEAGAGEAARALQSFKRKIDTYRDERDYPAVSGTSGLSIFLKNGSLTSAQIIKALRLRGIPWGQSTGPNQYLKEIVWREFYYHILFHRPDVETGAFNPRYLNIEWPNRADFFERWKEGSTGFPIVDAGMRQLRETGWMHNRVRMIVASFLTKDLLVDWRWGERHFMQHLLDGDLAPNNGGWQWAASTGCDPQPYFRIFNPWLQSEKFDPDGKYIKRYVPELKNCTAKDLHRPDGDRSPARYPAPMVDHQRQKEKAIRLYTSQK